MGELIIGWAEQKSTEQSVAAEYMLAQTSMAPTKMSAMQLHNDTKKPWLASGTNEHWISLAMNQKVEQTTLYFVL